MLRAAALFNELGFGVRVDGDKVRFLVELRTAYANPDGVLAKFLAIQPKQFFTGEAGTLAKQIADGAPSSPFAADFAAGYGGLMVPAAGIGMVSAIAIPAFMDYMKKSKRGEAQLQLNRLGRTPRSRSSPTRNFRRAVSRSRRQVVLRGGGTCNDAAAWQNPTWQALDFSIDEPHMFRYAYESDGKTFTAKAVGDLDCDGTEVTYTLTGTAEGRAIRRSSSPSRRRIRTDGSVRSALLTPAICLRPLRSLRSPVAPRLGHVAKDRHGRLSFPRHEAAIDRDARTCVTRARGTDDAVHRRHARPLITLR